MLSIFEVSGDVGESSLQASVVSVDVFTSMLEVCPGDVGESSLQASSTISFTVSVSILSRVSQVRSAIFSAQVLLRMLLEVVVVVVEGCELYGNAALGANSVSGAIADGTGRSTVRLGTQNIPLPLTKCCGGSKSELDVEVVVVWVLLLWLLLVMLLLLLLVKFPAPSPAR